MATKAPIELRLLAGNPNQRPIPEPQKKAAEAKLKAKKKTITKPTASLRDKEAVQEWNRMVKLLEGYRVLNETDQRALLLYCNTWSVYYQADRQLLAEGFLVYTGQGAPVAHPAARIMAAARDRCVILLKEFGMTPASRGNPQKMPEEEKDALAVFQQENTA